MPRIFEPYFTTREMSLYPGMGLYMAKTLLESLLAGTIRAENIKNGSRFTIELAVT